MMAFIHRHLLDFWTLVPGAVAQLGIFFLLWRFVRRRFSKWSVAAYLLIAAAAGGFLVIGALASSPRYELRLPFSWAWLGFFRAGAFLWGFASTCAFYIYVVYAFIAHRRSVEFNPSRRRAMQTAGGIAVAAPFVATAFAALVERTNFQVREVDIPIHNLPADLAGLRILQLSDIHLSAFLSEREFARVVDASNELNADLALITGDLISYHGDPLDACLRQVARVRAKSGVFGSLGNHERYIGAENYTADQAAKLGVPFLRHQARPLKFGNSVLNLAGVDYQRMGARKTYLVGVENLIIPGAVNVLMSHNPDVMPVAAGQGWDLVASGHTHGGQVTVEILDRTVNLARIFTPFVSGLYRIGNTCGYVTRGIGTIGLPARLGAPPEITVFRLKQA
jgi:predicted MPP superfamily phosphohydrolase